MTHDIREEAIHQAGMYNSIINTLMSNSNAKMTNISTRQGKCIHMLYFNDNWTVVVN